MTLLISVFSIKTGEVGDPFILHGKLQIVFLAIFVYGILTEATRYNECKVFTDIALL
jgi:hypothetical protein